MKILRLNFVRQRHFWKNMDCSVLTPPASVRGMRELKREKFVKEVQIPRLRINEDQTNRVLPIIKKFLLKMERLRPVRSLTSAMAGSQEREILLHPLPVKCWESLPIKELEELQLNADNFYFDVLELNYENWRADEIFKSVLPAEQEGLTSYSRIGHIVHLNLRDHLLPYKSLIGEVLCDKVAGCRTVVNKASTIDNTYRNFQLELICGQPDYQVETKENGIPFEFDFSRVYWNPRLSTEHERIVEMLRPGDVLYDVFAGVGPFSVPTAKKGCHVLANDLNPESFRWLQHNVKRNKCISNAKLFNKDGRDFILADIKADLLKRWTETKHVKDSKFSIHITMNLPAMAVEFLDAFRGLFQEEAQEQTIQLNATDLIYPIVHVYAFAKGENTQSLVQSLVEQNLGLPLGANLQGIHFVRNVAPNKDMYRVSFRLTEEILTIPKDTVLKEQESTKLLKRSANDVETEQVAQNPKVKCTR